MERNYVELHEIILHARQRRITQADSDFLENLWTKKRIFLAGFILHAVAEKNNSKINSFIDLASSMEIPAYEVINASSLLGLIVQPDSFIQLGMLLLEKSPTFLVACNIKYSLATWVNSPDPRILSLALKCDEIAPDKRISKWIDKVRNL